MIIGKNCEKELSTILNGHEIPISTAIKYLGIEIDVDLNFQNRSTEISKRLNQSIGAVAVLRNKLSVKSLLKFYFAHFNSHLTYAAFLLVRLTCKEIQQLQSKQNQILKMIYKLPATYSTHLIYSCYATGVLPIMGLIFMAVAVQIKKSILEHDPTLINTQKLRSTRTSQLKIPKSRTKLRYNDVEVIGSSIFNSIHENIRNIDDLQQFKAKLKEFLLTKTTSLVSAQQMFNRGTIL
jgi:hypothetical protein